LKGAFAEWAVEVFWPLEKILLLVCDEGKEKSYAANLALALGLDLAAISLVSFFGCRI